MLKVIISNGHFKFILGPAAAEAYKRGILDGFITAGYPTQKVKQWVSIFGLARYGIVKRLLNREESVPDSLVHPLWTPEFITQIGIILRKILKTNKYSEKLDNYSLRLYGNQASRIIQASSANIYHYRSGYGHISVKLARQKGMITLCDHSIAHPATLQYLIDNQGNLPQKNFPVSINLFWSNVMEDIDQAQEILVNSDFVKETFVLQGWAPERVHVVYAGIDSEFLDAVPIRRYESSNMPISLLFAGEFGPRKGAEILILALQEISDLPWQIKIIGSIDPAIKLKFDTFLSDNRVTLAGFLPRLELAEHMSKADIFVFPSLAEGSARVVFMAMASGCYVITTPNSGSLVENGIHGLQVKAGDVEALRKAIRKAIIMNRNDIAQIGMNNAELVRNNFTQSHYGENLFKVYKDLLNNPNLS